MNSTSVYLIARLPTEKAVLAEEHENNNPKWTLASMEKYMRDQVDASSLALGLVPRHSKECSNQRYPSPVPCENEKTNGHSNEKLAQNGDIGGENADAEESSPSWASGSTGNDTPSYGSVGMTFEFNNKVSEQLKTSVTAPVITTTNCTPTSTPNERRKSSGRTKDSKNLDPNGGSLELLSTTVDSDHERNGEQRFKRKPRKGSADNAKDTSHCASSGSRLSRLLRRTHSAGAQQTSKDVPDTISYPRDKPPVTKTKSADAAPCRRHEEDESKKRNRSTLAQDMKMRLSFLRRRHTDTSLQTSVRPSPEEAKRWSASFNELTSSKYGMALFRAFLSREFSEENFDFWLACQDYKRTRANKLPSKARKIYEEFVAVQSPKEVNLEASMRSEIAESLSNPTHHSFDTAQTRIQGLMEEGYRRFLKSDLYTELLQ